MLRPTLIYGLLLALIAVGLQWLEFQYMVRTHATETYIALIALAFLGLGIWAGARLFHRAPAARDFTPNHPFVRLPPELRWPNLPAVQQQR